MEKVFITSFNQEHIQATFEWIKEKSFRELFLMRGEISWSNHLDYFHRVLADPCQKVYAIFAGNKHVGNCGLKSIDPLQEQAELWIYIGDIALRRQGTGKQATNLLLLKGFDELHLSKIYLHVADFNIAARKMYEKIGFCVDPDTEQNSEWTNRDCKVMRMQLDVKKFSCQN